MERHSITIAGRRTNVTLENGFWVGLRGIAKQRHETLSHLVANIKANNRQTNLASALRLYVLDYYGDQYHRRLDTWSRQNSTSQGFRPPQGFE